jgi:CDP-4-dehydro-6-deoxyglucose reductase
MHLHFQIPWNPGCGLSDHVFNKLKHGDLIEINGPQGNFILDEDSPRPLVFIAWRTGFAPIRSLVEHAMALEVADSIHVVWVAEHKKARFLDNLCRSWADALDNFHYLPVDVDLRRGDLDSQKSIFGRLGIKAENLAGHDFYIAGNKLLLADCQKALASHGVKPARIKINEIVHI